jgi:FkbM family methyltransferase
LIEVIVRNIPLYIHEDGPLSNSIRRDNDFFEAEILDYLRDNFNKQNVILDIGANIGNHTIYFAKNFEYEKIYAFEPILANFEILDANCARLAPDIGRANYALSDRYGTLNMSINYGNMGASEVNPEGSVTVPCCPLDGAGEFGRISLIKIDVEWHEPEIIAGAEETIQRDHPLILIEDANNEYASLLPDYECIKAWEGHKTYLYKWRD